MCGFFCFFMFGLIRLYFRSLVFQIRSSRMLIQSILKMRYHELERRMFLRTVIISLAAILFYIIYDIWMGNFTEKLYTGFLGLVIFSSCLWVTIKAEKLQTVIYYNSFFFISSIFGSFFTMNGFKGAFALDLLNLYLCIGLLTSGSSKKYIIGVTIVLTILFAHIQLNYPYLVTDIRQGDSYLVILIFMLLRFVLTLSLGLTVKEEFEKERSIISEMNQHLFKKNEEIQNINNKLEILVEIRTQEILSKNQQLMEFAYFNAHNIRGPLARMMGLIYVLKKSNVSISELPEYIENLDESSKDLDLMIKKINTILEEGLANSNQNLN